MINMVVATSDDGVIGMDNELPWNIPNDLKRFRKITDTHCVVMGRATFDSIIKRNGKALPNRTNVVLTRNKKFHNPKADDVIHNIADIFKLEKEHGDVFIIGGADLYSQMIEYTDRIYLTIVNGNFEGDAFFPISKLENFTLEYEGQYTHKKTKYSFLVAERIQDDAEDDTE